MDTMYRGRFARESRSDDPRYSSSMFGSLFDFLEYHDYETVRRLNSTELGAAASPGDEEKEEERTHGSGGAGAGGDEAGEPEVVTPPAPVVVVEPSEPDVVPEPEKPKPKPKPLAVKDVNLCIFENVNDHHTKFYEQTQARQPTDEPRQLVVRRGQTIKLKVTLDRAYDKQVDEVKLVFEIGEQPLISKGTSVTLKIDQGLPKRKWGCSIQDVDENVLELSVLTPPDCIVGRWKLIIDTNVKVEGNGEPGRKKKMRYRHKQPVYVLFNAYCKDDQVYMEDDVMLDEYIVADAGKVYNGNSKQVYGRPWGFGQYEDFMLDCVLYLLDLSKLKVSVRGNPVHVVRAISAAVNSSDDNGVLIGNWSGNYEGGTRPTAWTGSAAILEEYWKTKTPVKYGQCWVFSGLTTSVCRCLGIPCRSVTNYASAHDTDASMTIDKYWDEKRKPLGFMSNDSVWNFHVWNEAYMTRPDLGAEYGGWQAFDATPQETSEGMYRAGPCPVLAIKQGQVNLPHDTPFIFAEVNADRVNWYLQPDGTWHTKLEKQSIGKRISTRRPRNQAAVPNPLSHFDMVSRFLDDKDRLDITDQYKFPEGSEDERAAVYRASTWSSNPYVYDSVEEDVKFEVIPKDGIMVGQAFDIQCNVQNKSRHERSVDITVTLQSSFYTGVTESEVKSGDFKLHLGPIKSEEVLMRVLPEEYLHHIVDQVAFRISVMAKVAETDQVYTGEEDFRLRRPDPVIELPKKAKIGETIKCKISFANSMPIHLTQCSWLIESPGIQRAMSIDQKDLEPFERCSIELDLKPYRVGPTQVICSFNTKELNDLSDAAEILVEE